MLLIGDADSSSDFNELLDGLEGFLEAVEVIVNRVRDCDWLNGSELAADVVDGIENAARNMTWDSVNQSCGNILPVDGRLGVPSLVSYVQNRLQGISDALSEDVAAYNHEQVRVEWSDEDEDDDGEWEEDVEPIPVTPWHEGPSDPVQRRGWLESGVPFWEARLNDASPYEVKELEEHLPRLRDELADIQARERLGL